MNGEWRLGPYGLDAAKGTTLTGRRTVLVVVHHVTAGTRLADVVPLLESDRRVQVIYTASPGSILSVGVEDYLRALGGLVIPYDQSLRLSFDLAVAAGHGRLQELNAPVLMLSHGVPPGVLSHRWVGRGPAARRLAAGANPEAIVAGGRVIPSAIAVAHEGHGARLTDVCPEARSVTVVAGDPALDRIRSSVQSREAYRQALGAGPEHCLVFVSSTWGPRSLLGRQDDLLVRLALALPRERYRIVAAFHPNVWCWHGRRQVTAWYEDCRRLGVRLLPPEQGWQGALVAADRIVGDHGSVTCYGAALGVPTALSAFPDEDVVPGSEIEMLGQTSARLDVAAELEPQLAACRSVSANALFARLTSRPGRSAGILRRVMYELMDLPEPAMPPRVEPVPLPQPIGARP